MPGKIGKILPGEIAEKKGEKFYQVKTYIYRRLLEEKVGKFSEVKQKIGLESEGRIYVWYWFLAGKIIR